jgi:iron complex transport system ATP-binding protein
MHKDQPPDLSARDLRLAYEGKAVVEGLDLQLHPGRITTVVGPNGSGKSTVLRALARLMRPSAGDIVLDGRSIHSTPSREVAQRLAILPQTPTAPEGLTVESLVWYGRHPYQGAFGGRSDADREAVAAALSRTGMTVFASRRLETLSGGQRQRAWIAMALAQGTPLLLLDEPTTYLDLSHQLEVLLLLTRLNAEEGKSIVMVLHDLNQAARFSHDLVVVAAGRVVARGEPREVINREMLRDVFALEAHILADPDCGAPLVVPYALARAKQEGKAPASVKAAPGVDGSGVGSHQPSGVRPR